MKKTFKIWLLVAAFGVLTAVAAGIAFNNGYFGFSSNAERAAGEIRSRQADIGDRQTGAGGEDVLSRSGWFIKQRTFGLGEIPAEGRRNAKEAADLLAPPVSETDGVANFFTPVGPQPLDSFLSAAAYGDASGRINWVAVSPADNNIVLLGTSTGGIWRSTNALAADSSQVAFAPVTDNQVDLAVGSVAFAPSAPTTVYAAMGDQDNGYLGTGILKSTDAGATWTRLTTNGIPDKGTSLSITVRANDANTVYVVRGEPSNQSRNTPGLDTELGFYRSTDGGLNWTRTLNGKVSSVVERPNDSTVIYASVLTSNAAGAAAPGIYKSTDAGATFALVANSPDISMAADYRAAINAADSNKIYFYGGVGGDANANPPNQGNLKLIVLTDDLNTQTFTTNNILFSQLDPTQFGYNTYLIADPSPTGAGKLYVGARDIFRLTVDTNTNMITNSENLTLGYTYNAGTMRYDNTEPGSKAHVDHHHLAFAGTSGTQFIGAHDGGISRTSDAGATFTKNLNRTLSLDQAVGLSVKPSDNTKIYVGAQDNGTQRRLNGLNWKEFQGGDGGPNRLIPPNFTGLYANSTNGAFSRFDNVETATGNPNNNESVNLNDPSAGGHRISFYPPSAVNGVDSTLYVGTETLSVCADCGTTAGTWTYPANGNGQDLTRGAPDVINTMAVQKLADGAIPAIYTGSEQGALWVRQTGSQMFTNRTAVLDAAVNGAGQPNRFISRIRMDANDPATAYITVSGFGTTRHVLKTTDYGATITPLNFTVDIPVNDFVIDPATATTFYIGTDIGIFRSTDSGATWNQFNSGMPPVVVTRLESTNAAGTFLTKNDAPTMANTITAATYGRGVFQSGIPTAASVTVAGRVMSSKGGGVSNAVVTITDSSGSVRRVKTSSFGFYRIDDVSVGQTYTFNVSHRRFRFSPIIITVNEELNEFNFASNN